MNYITKITAHGLKSGDFTHTLERVNLITGKSAAGKTARIDALRLALNGGTLLGRASDLKSRTIDIMDLARNGSIEVAATDDVGRTVRRRWIRGKACVILEDALPQTPDILMDPNEYISLSDAKKIEYAFSLFKMDDAEFSHAAIVAQLKNIRLEENTDATEESIEEILRLAHAQKWAESSPVQEWLSVLLSGFKKHLSNAEAEARRMTATVQGITQLAADAPALRDPSPNLISERAKATKLLGEKQMLEQQLADLRALIERRAVIQREILDLQDNPLAVQMTKNKIEELEQEIARIEAAPLSLPAEFAGLDEGRMRVEMESLSAEVQAHKSPLDELRTARATLGGQISYLKDEISLYEKATKENEAMYERYLGQACCPTCGADPKHWTGFFSKEAMQAKRDIEMRDRAKVLVGKKGSLSLLISNLENMDKAITAQQAIDLKIEEKRLRSNQLFATLRKYSEAEAKARTQRDGVLKTKRFHLSQHREYLAGLQDLGTRRAEKEARLAELTLDGRPSEAALQTQINQRTAELTDCETTIAELERQRTAFIQAQTDERRNAQALVEHQRAKVNVEVTKAAIAKLEKIQADMVSRAFESILKTVNAITEGIVDAPIEYRSGVIGRWNGSTFIPHESFSGTEKALTYAGISLALAKDAAVKIVLVDELGRLDETSLGIFLERMIKLASDGMIDQFVGAYSTDILMKFTGVNIITL